MAANCTLPFKVVWNTDTSSLATATRRDSASKTIYIPMTTSRSFRSVQVRVTVQDVTSAGDCTLTNPLVGIKLGAAAFSDVTLGNPAGASSDQQSWVFVRDVTSYFNSNFGSGASQTCQVGFQASLAGTSPSLNNITIEIIGSVDVDDVSDNTQFNYVEFLCDSSAGALTATLTEIGTNQFPALDTVLGEASKTIRQVWIEVEGNNGAVGTANDASLEIQVDSETAWASALNETAGGSLNYVKYIYDVTSLSLATNAAHAIKLRSTNITTAATFNHLSVKVCVFYEYSWSASSAITNMVKVPFCIGNRLDVSGSGNSGAVLDIPIQEPASITVVQSGVQLYFTAVDNTTISIGAGAQVVRTYTPATGTYGGGLSLSQRIDSGGAQGEALAFARGRNKLVVFAYASAASTYGTVGGWLTLVYKSGKSSLGRKAHVRAIPTLIFGTTAASGNSLSGSGAGFNLLDTSFYVVGMGYEVTLNTTNNSNFHHTVSPKGGGGELGGAYIYPDTINMLRMESENAAMIYALPVSKDMWQRWSGDPKSDRLALGTSRSFYMGGIAANASLTGWVCYHGNKKALSGVVSNSGGGTVNIRGYSESLKECIGETSRSGDGAYSIPWFDDMSADCRVTANEDGSHSTCSGMGAAA